MGTANQKKDSIPEPKGKVKKSTTGKNDGQTKAPKGSTEKLKGGNKSVKRKGQAGH